MNPYIVWNDALASHFFNPGMEGRIVYLDVNPNVLSDIRKRLEPAAGDFINAVKIGPPWAYRRGVCQQALQALQYWQHQRSGYPPYIAYLSLFVLAAGSDGDYSHNAYYPRLRDLLDEPGDGPLPSFDRMWRLWDDLETWASLDRRGELGIFESRTTGGFRHIGYPISQCILSEQDRIALPQVFFGAGLDPATFHPADELARALRNTATSHLLLPRTLRIAENPRNELHGQLIETVIEELANWDGSVAASGYGSRSEGHYYGGLRLCLEVDSVAGIARTYIRCKLSHEFPEKGLSLQEGFIVDEDVNGWSLPIRNFDTGEPLDSSKLDWHRSLTMRTVSQDYLLRLQGQQVRIFVSGAQEGITGFVETHVLPRGRSFYLCYPEVIWPKIEEWATTECNGFTNLSIVQGLPQFWRLAYIDEALDDQAVRNNISLLSFPPDVRIRIVGGIRSGARNNYFDFAPPSVEVIGGSPDIAIYCNDDLLPNTTGGGVIPLPEGAPIGTRITIEARAGQSVLQRRSLFLTGDFSPALGEPLLKLGSDGAEIDTTGEVPSVAGACIADYKDEIVATQAAIFRDLEQEIGGIRGFLAGSNPGEIVEWPSGSFPGQWKPSWIISKRGRKRWEPIYIGDMFKAPAGGNSFSPTDRQLREWKKAIWYRRKQFQLPYLPDERALWREIQRVAANV